MREAHYRKPIGFWLVMAISLIAHLFALAGCGSPAVSPGIEVRTVEVVKEVQRPCPVTKPVRPAGLDRPLPADSVALAALIAAKLAEWAGPGGYGERAEAALDVCVKP